MKIVGEYSFNHGKKNIQENYNLELSEVKAVIRSIQAEETKNKISEEITSTGEIFYSPKELNKEIKKSFLDRSWDSDIRVRCNYPTEYYINEYSPPETRGAFRSMDFLKNKVGIEVQFGKYSFMVYNVAAKMTIFHNLGIIDVGIEIVPVKEMAVHMSSGVSYFEQFIWDLEERGVSDIDIPVLILGICPEKIVEQN